MLKTNDLLEAGIDEAGRGPLFGRVYAGVCIWNPEIKTDLIRDSKKLSARKRQIAYDFIKENAIDYAVGWEDEKTIDKINILQATQSAMHKGIRELLVRPVHLLVDGNFFRAYIDEEGRNIPHTCVERGDSEYISIAAASILAKVEHDKYIEDMCDKYENLDEFYGLRSNKGYGTKKHMDGIKKYGVTEWHRKSFRPCHPPSKFGCQGTSSPPIVGGSWGAPKKLKNKFNRKIFKCPL